MGKAKMMKVKDHERILANIQNAQSSKPIPVKIDIEFLKPLAVWYSMLTESQKKDLPIRVLNALDSLHMIMKGRL